MVNYPETSKVASGHRSTKVKLRLLNGPSVLETENVARQSGRHESTGRVVAISISIVHQAKKGGGGARRGKSPTPLTPLWFFPLRSWARLLKSMESLLGSVKDNFAPSLILL
jgi:hypothetical protein